MFPHSFILLFVLIADVGHQVVLLLVAVGHAADAARRIVVVAVFAIAADVATAVVGSLFVHQTPEAEVQCRSPVGCGQRGRLALLRLVVLVRAVHARPLLQYGLLAAKDKLLLISLVHVKLR